MIGVLLRVGMTEIKCLLVSGVLLRVNMTLIKCLSVIGVLLRVNAGFYTTYLTWSAVSNTNNLCSLPGDVEVRPYYSAVPQAMLRYAPITLQPPRRC